MGRRKRGGERRRRRRGGRKGEVGWWCTIVGAEGVGRGDLSRIDLGILFVIRGQGDERQRLLPRVLYAAHFLSLSLLSSPLPFLS
jgi:hypothetical protein